MKKFKNIFGDEKEAPKAAVSECLLKNGFPSQIVGEVMEFIGLEYGDLIAFELSFHKNKYLVPNPSHGDGWLRLETKKVWLVVRSAMYQATAVVDDVFRYQFSFFNQSEGKVLRHNYGILKMHKKTRSESGSRKVFIMDASWEIERCHDGWRLHSTNYRSHYWTWVPEKNRAEHLLLTDERTEYQVWKIHWKATTDAMNQLLR